MRPVTALLLALLAVLWTGCAENKPPEPIPLDQLSSALEAAFRDAAPETRKLVDDVRQLVEKKAFSEAHMALQALSSRPDLSTEQKRTIGGCILTVSQELQAAEAAGQQQAAEYMRAHRSEK